MRGFLLNRVLRDQIVAMSAKKIRPVSPADWRALRAQLNHTFTPHKPIRDEGVFNGRDRLLQQVSDTVSQPGKHVIIYGERGLGKTSFANVAARELAQAPRVTVIRKSCTVEHTFGMIWRELLHDYELNGKKAKQALGDKPSVHDVFDWVNTLHKANHYVFILDEFDRMQDREGKKLLADLIKQLSDEVDYVTVILVGVARNLADLFADHESLPRAMMQVKMPRMASDELKEIIESRLPDIGMGMGANALDAAVSLSQGFPGYTHLLALHAGRAAIARQSIEIAHADLESALQEALADVQERIGSAYKKAVRSSRQNNYEEVLLACALAQGDEQGMFAPNAVSKALEQTLKKKLSGASFSRNLAQFCEEARGPTLIKQGANYGFDYALLKPFVLMKGVEKGRILMRDVR
jgi:Cdc6-like AAA superfamily ATPase